VTEFATDFDLFWAAFPRRQAKKDALRAWRMLKPDTELVQAMLDALAWQTRTDQWKRGIIPLPATYLRGERWMDEPPPQTSVIREQQRQQGHAWIGEYDSLTVWSDRTLSLR